MFNTLLPYFFFYKINYKPPKVHVYSVLIYMYDLSARLDVKHIIGGSWIYKQVLVVEVSKRNG